MRSSQPAERTQSIIDLLTKKNPFAGAPNLSEPPRPDEGNIPRDVPASKQLEHIQEQLNILSYNHLPHTFFSLEKHRPLDCIIQTGKLALTEALPIRCLEATFVSLYLTQCLPSITRIPLSFGSWAGGKYYSHIVLVIYMSHPEPRYGALGLSRKSTLMYKPMIFESLFSLVMDYKHEYEVLGHKLSEIRLGLAFTHDTPSFRHPCWRFVALKLSSYAVKAPTERDATAGVDADGKAVPTRTEAEQMEPADADGKAVPTRTEAEQMEPAVAEEEAVETKATEKNEEPSVPKKTTTSYEPLCTFLTRYMRMLPAMSDQHNKVSLTEMAVNRSARLCFSDLDSVDCDPKAENHRRVELIGSLVSPLGKDALNDANGARLRYAQATASSTSTRKKRGDGKKSSGKRAASKGRSHSHAKKVSKTETTKGKRKKSLSPATSSAAALTAPSPPSTITTATNGATAARPSLCTPISPSTQESTIQENSASAIAGGSASEAVTSFFSRSSTSPSTGSNSCLADDTTNSNVSSADNSGGLQAVTPDPALDGSGSEKGRG